MSKIFQPDEIADLVSIIEAARRIGKKIVVTNGCFDMLHPGHIDLLKRCKAHGDILVVMLNTDSALPVLTNVAAASLSITIPALPDAVIKKPPLPLIADTILPVALPTCCKPPLLLVVVVISLCIPPFHSP